MKCAKCGYISFDHHSECKKCQTSMASVRQDLGLPTAKPATPSLLGSLLRDYQPTAQQNDQAADTEAHVPFSMQEEISGALNEGFRSEPADAAHAVADPEEAQEDFSLLDLSDEELELLIEQDASGHEEKEQIEPSGLVDGEADTYPHEQPSSLHDDPAPLEIAMPEEAAASLAEEPLLSFDDFLETETPNPPDLAAASGEASVRPDSEEGLTIELEHAEEHAEQHAEAQPGDSEKEFVIDLSESELDALLKRLEGDTKGKA